MKYHNLRLKSSCVACLLLCESGREAITQKNVIDINSHEETNTKHSQWRHLKFTVFECARNYRPFRSAISALVWASPNLFQQKQTGLPWTDREALCQPTPLGMKCLWARLHEQLCQQSRKDCNLWGEVITEQLEKETSSAQMCTDSSHIWLQPEPTIFFLSSPVLLKSYFVLLFGCSYLH